MPELYLGPAKRAPTAETPNVTVPANMFAGESEALQRIGGEIQRSGNQLASIALQSQRLDYIDQLEAGKLEYGNFVTDFETQMANDTEFETQTKRFNEGRKKFAEEYLEGVTNNKAREKLQQYFDSKGARDELSVYTYAQAKRAERIEKMMPAMQRRNAEHWLNETEDDVKAKVRTDFVQTLSESVNAGIMTPERAQEHLRQRAVTLGMTAIKRDPELALKLIEGGDVDVLMSDADRKLLRPEDIDQLRTAANREISYRQASAKILNEQVLEKTRNEYLAKLYDKTMTPDKLSVFRDEILQSPLPTKGDLGKQEFLKLVDDKIKDINKGDEIVSDKREEARLERMAYDVSTGAKKYQDIAQEAAKSRYSERKIDDSAYDSIMSIANREHKTYQANAMGEAIDYGLRQLTMTDEQVTNMILTPEFAALSNEEKGKKIMSVKRLAEENYSQYKRAMNEWFQAEVAAGREPDDDDIYVKSRKLAAHYRDRALNEDIYNELNPEEAERIRRLGGFFKSPGGWKTGSFSGGGVTVVENKEQFDALPAGAVFIAPDGTKRVKK